MVNLRETEIRSESLEIVVETYQVASLIIDPSKQVMRTKLVDCAFQVSSSVAKVFIALQDDEVEENITQALSGIDTLSEYLHEIESGSLLDSAEIQPLRIILGAEKQELLLLLADYLSKNSHTISPKLERACI